MTVAELRKFIEGRPDDEHLCVLMFEKSSFDFLPDDELTLTDEGWKKCVEDFEAMSFSEVHQWLADTSIDYADSTYEEDDE